MLSAVEGLKVATPALAGYVVPLSVIVLVGLFILQSWGSARIGAYFGPVMAVWFAALAIFGLFQVVQNPSVIVALNPLYALHFLVQWTREHSCIEGGDSFANGNDLPRRRCPSARLLCQAIQEPRYWQKINCQADRTCHQPRTLASPSQSFVPTHT